MAWELCYTSAPRGLKPGSTGFCTVAATAGLPEVVAGKLEMLSGYKELFPPNDPRFGSNPVLWSHVRLSAQGRSYHVLSRVSAAPPDYTGRTNKFAHHVALEESELPPSGPAALMLRPGFLHAAWDGQVRHLPPRTGLPPADLPPVGCPRWQELTGDGNWAGALVADFLREPSRPVYLVYPLGVDLLPLLVEALALLPPEKRWEVTFSTFHRVAPAGISCAWRGLPAEAPEAAPLHRQPGARVLELGKSLGPAPPAALPAARSGRQVATSPPQPRESAAANVPYYALTPEAPAPLPHAARPAANLSDEGPAAGELVAIYPPLNPSGGKALSFLLGAIAGIVLAGVTGAILWLVLSPRGASSAPVDEHRKGDHEAEVRALQEKLQLQAKDLEESKNARAAVGQELKAAQTEGDRARNDLGKANRLLDQAKEEMLSKHIQVESLKAEAKTWQGERESLAKVLQDVLGIGPEECKQLAGPEGARQGQGRLPILAAQTAASLVVPDLAGRIMQLLTRRQLQDAVVLGAGRRQLLRERWSRAVREENELDKKLNDLATDIRNVKRRITHWEKLLEQAPRVIRDTLKVEEKRFETDSNDLRVNFISLPGEIAIVMEKTRSADTVRRGEGLQADLDLLRRQWADMEPTLKEYLPRKQ
jgi:hypothetical protein